MEDQDAHSAYIGIDNLIPKTIGSPPPIKEMTTHGNLDLKEIGASLIIDHSKIESIKETIKQTENDILILKTEIQYKTNIIKAKEEFIQLLSKIVN